jgi:hypothetical protein
MAGQIIGVNKSSLWLAWKEIRAQLRNASVRDVIDFLDYDIEPNVWIGRLLRHISSGGFEPNPPFRFPLAMFSAITCGTWKSWQRFAKPATVSCSQRLTDRLM